MPDKNTFVLADPGKLLREYQSGLSSDTPEAVDIQDTQETAQPQPSYRDYLRAAQLSNGVANDYTEEAKQAGFGLSRYDIDFAPDMDLENSRALEQSSFSKIGTGLVKGGITAATTAVNTTLGTVFGLGAAMYELAADSNGNGRGVMDTVDAGVNNWLSNQLVKVQNWAEEQFPNYRTEEERSEQYQKEWYKHMGTANFIGDSLLKNFGFTVGAMAGGMAWSRLIGAGLSKQLANNIMKGAITAAEGDAEAGALMKGAADAITRGETEAARQGLTRAAEAVARGTAVGVDADKIVENIKNAARSINRYGAKLQLYGAAVGAMGEGTVEGIMAKNEFLEDYNNKLQQNYAREYNSLEADILNSENYDWITFDSQEGPDGQLSYNRRLSQKGQEELTRRQQEVTDKYQKLRDFAEEEGTRLASTTYLLNLPILTTSNVVQFGRMFSGGYKTARNTLSAAKGGIGIKAGEKGALELTGDYASKFGKGAVAGKTILNSLKVAGSESFEEMAQGTVSSGTKQVADDHISAFNDAGYDKEAIDSYRSWIAGMYEGGGEYLGDIKNWQEGALGAITGLFGIPGKKWSGGAVGAYQEARDEVKASRDAANKLNALVNSKDFQDRWHGYIRHLKYDNDMQNAIQKDDEYAWHTADDAQLISDVMTFADAGRLEDLNQIADAYANISASDASGLRDVLKNDTENDWTKNASDKEIVDKVKKQADRIKSAVQEYKDIYDAMSTRAPIGSSPEFIKENVFTAMQIKAFDRRFLEMFGETMEGIEPILYALAAVDENGEVLSAEKSADKFKTLRDSYERLYAGTLIPVRLPKAMQSLIDSQLDMLEELTEEEDSELNKKIKDMRKLSEDRKNFYKKLQTLQGEKAQQKFEEKAVTQEKVDEAAEQAFAKQETEGLNTFEDVRTAYLSKDANGKIDFLKTIETLEESNPTIKSFLQTKRRIDSFKAFIDKNGVSVDDMTVTPPMIQSAINDLLRKAKNEQDVINLPDNMFSTYDEFARDNAGIFGTPGPSTHAALKKALRDAMAKYMAGETATASRNTVSPQQTTTPPAPGTVSTPSGYDAAQPASLEPAPQAQESSPSAPAAAQAPSGAQAEEPVVKSATEEQLVDDAAEAAGYDPDAQYEGQVVQKDGEKDKIAYYRTSVPEIASKDAAEARKAIKSHNRDKLKEIDLSDFVKNHSEFETIWNALNQREAFANTANLLAVGDMIEFVVDPTFPTYEGQYQILLTVTKGGERKVLNILSSQTDKYYNLAELRKAIDDEYQAFVREHPNDVFVFSKKATAWAKRPGLIDYDFSGKEEKGIVNIPGYSDDAPIVFINREGEAEVIKGSDKTAGDKVSKDFNDAEQNKAQQKRGNLYYLVQSPNGMYDYVPIRLNVEHFKEENKNSDSPVFQKIRDILGNIASIVNEANNSNLGEQNEKLRKQMEQLTKYLDLHDVFFEIADLDNVGVAFRYSSPADEKGALRRPDQMTAAWLTDLVAGFDRSLQIRKDKNGKIANLKELVDTGMITSNARMLRPKGVDFYIEPWDAELGEFAPGNNTQSEIIETAKETTPSRPTKEEPVRLNTSDDFGDREFFGGFDEEPAPAYGEKPVSKAITTGSAEEKERRAEQADEQAQETLQGKQADDPIFGLVTRNYSELPANYQEGIKAKGYSEEEYNELPELLKEKVLHCLGV